MYSVLPSFINVRAMRAKGRAKGRAMAASHASQEASHASHGCESACESQLLKAVTVLKWVLRLYNCLSVLFEMGA